VFTLCSSHMYILSHLIFSTTHKGDIAMIPHFKMWSLKQSKVTWLKNHKTVVIVMFLPKTFRQLNLQWLRQSHQSHIIVFWKIIRSVCLFSGCTRSGLASLRISWSFPSWAHNGCPGFKHPVPIQVKKKGQGHLPPAFVPLDRKSRHFQNPHQLSAYLSLVKLYHMVTPPTKRD
jgi:hypothetical protein